MQRVRIQLSNTTAGWSRSGLAEIAEDKTTKNHHKFSFRSFLACLKYTKLKTKCKQ